MNAFELHEAAFDSACDYSAETTEYVQQYANGAFGITVSDTTAQAIIDCRVTFSAGDGGSNNYYYEIEKPLSAIEI